MLRLIVLWAIAGVPMTSDSIDYREMALSLLKGGQFTPYWPPGLPLYLVPFLALGLGDVALRASMLVWWILFCLGVLRLSRDLDIEMPAILMALGVWSVTPAFIHLSLEPLTQMPSAALLLLGLSATVRCRRRPGVRESLLLGASVGWLSLVRPSALPLIVVFPLLVYVNRRRWKEPLIAFAVAATMIFMWAAKAHQLSGKWAINNSNEKNLYYGNNPWTPLYRSWYFGSHAKLETDEIREFPDYEKVLRQIGALPPSERGAAYEKRALEYVLHRPDLFLLRTANRVRCFWGFDTFTAANLHASESAGGRRWFPVVFVLDAACYLVIAGFAFFWIAAAPGDFWRRWEVCLLSVTVALYGLPYWVTMSHPTYHFPVIAPVALLGALARQLVRSSGEGSRARGWAALAVLFLIQGEWVFYIIRNQQRPGP